MSANVNNEKEIPQITCDDYSINAAALEEEAYGAMEFYDWVDAVLAYFNACEAAGGPGNIADPIFL